MISPLLRLADPLLFLLLDIVGISDHTAFFRLWFSLGMRGIVPTSILVTPGVISLVRLLRLAIVVGTPLVASL